MGFRVCGGTCSRKRRRLCHGGCNARKGWTRFGFSGRKCLKLERKVWLEVEVKGPEELEVGLVRVRVQAGSVNWALGGEFGQSCWGSRGVEVARIGGVEDLRMKNDLEKILKTSNSRFQILRLRVENIFNLDFQCFRK